MSPSVPAVTEVGPEKLAASFHGFVEHHVDLSRAPLTEPVFTAPPAIDGEGKLLLKGYSPLPDRQWYFDLAYVYEHPEWKLISIEVSTQAIK